MASPFKTNSIADQIMAKRTPMGGVSMEQEEAPEAEAPEADEGDEGLNTAARDLIDAVQAGDEAGVAAAFKAAFQILESAPHEEAEHEEAPEMGEGEI